MNKLYIAGCGIKFLSHLTLEVKAIIQQSDCVVYLVNDPAMKRWILENSRTSFSLDEIYFDSSLRSNSYDSICNAVINFSHEYETICFVTYGHPYFLSNVSQNIVEKIEEKKLPLSVEILPGISSLDTMLCDLRIDPVKGGLQAYETTEFINNTYCVNTNGHLILWQIGIAGIKSIINNDEDLLESKCRGNALSVLKEKLLSIYHSDHHIILYVASMYPSIPCTKTSIPLYQLNSVDIPRLATAYLPPK